MIDLSVSRTWKRKVCQLTIIVEGFIILDVQNFNCIFSRKSCKKSHACPERRKRISLLPAPFLSATSYLLWLKRGVRNLWQKMDHVILSGAWRINTMPCRYKLAYVIDHISMIYCERKKFVRFLNLKRAAPSSKKIQQLFIVWKTVCPSLLFFLVKCT